MPSFDHVEVSKSALRDRAIAFSKRWEGAASEKAESQLFWNDFFAIFGLPLRNVGYFEVAAKRLSTGNRGWIDLLVPGEMGVEQKSAGEDLNAAMNQLVDYLDSLQPVAMPKLLVACDFQNFYCQDLETLRRTEFKLQDLSQNIEIFWWLAGHRERVKFESDEAANLEATGYMAEIYDAVLDSGYDHHSLREWLTRILFCLFADHTEVWNRNAFGNYLFLNTKPDGSDLGRTLADLFQTLNTPDINRSRNLDPDLREFTYINGDLFANQLPIPSCNEKIRVALLEACKFDWSVISPAIFGSMFQNVMTPAERRHLGAHYTTEENILKTIRPLFLDELEKELASVNVTSSPQSRAKLEAFHNKIATLTFFDPACGCGNFLVIAYRELRRLEIEVLRKLSESRGEQMSQVIDLSHLFKVTVGQFYGIEIEEFPARIARTALYLMDHKENLAASKEFGQYFARFPIPMSPHILIANALRIDWNDVIPAVDADFVMGNPPFAGALLLDVNQTEDRATVFNSLPEATGLQPGRLDYVLCWYAKAFQYFSGLSGRVAFVSTNSITQGEQARSLGPLMERCGYEIDFAYRTFSWTSDATGKAVVHCVIVGFSAIAGGKTKVLFDADASKRTTTSSSVTNINAWLIDAPNVTLTKRRSPFSEGLPSFTVGSQPTDAGGLVFNEDVMLRAMSDPLAAQYIRPLLGAEEMLHGSKRWCLWMVDADPTTLAGSDFLRERLGIVRAAREKSPTKNFRETPPYLFTHRKQPKTPYIAVPRHSSENRRVVPMAPMGPEVIAHDSLMIVTENRSWIFAIMQSAMYTSWIRTVCGRLKSDIRVSGDLAYNAFPFPDVDQDAKSVLATAAEGILEARSAHPDASLADLYEPLAMPVGLIKAHDALDRVVDSLFAASKRFNSDADRLTVLFERYEMLTS